MTGRLEPTIAAIATPPGPGGIGIVRISGPSSLTILNLLFTPKRSFPSHVSHRLTYGWIKQPHTGRVVDEVMAVFMAAPHTYTREDVVEIHCHGSYLILQDILVLIQEAGARLAEPGEFTKRAFLNGRLDLTQAEAVLDLLQARSHQGVRLAINQLHGTLQGRVQQLLDALVRLRAIIEVAIDFPDEEIDIINPVEIGQSMTQNILPVLEGLILAADSGKVFRDGISVVIVGRPNVGKSSLLNVLLQEDRAIVTSEAGTTRDTIEEEITVKGMPVRIIDTAGIRASKDSVEAIGIQRSRQKMAMADVVLLVLDAAEPLHQDDQGLIAEASMKHLVVVANKSDLCSDGVIDELRESLDGHPVVAISAKHGTGVRDLEDAIFSLVTGQGGGWDPGYTTVPNARHRAALAKALTSCYGLLAGLGEKLSPDLLAIELQTILDHLGEVVGYTTTEDVLDTIFGEFCIGK
ncbi:MAG: tRNA uridine-5-carboxymethylaminomethyl(34) synthesis GTPase MnmE [Proteobacteria bacterium]|nr:tRNA uridine-5-carboxymethylaminomethyl(34) synthesis GTPase MnmE [Desulfobulbaceae bacterium]MBU4153554.1 tRNA uridine-5-carboxymethylaminomethyl(34) synthesis GTPase MnmE [Pseudomonadota bacterium]